jgi:hypothetical protein
MNSINRAEQSCDVCWRLMGVANLRNCDRVLCGGDVANVDELWCWKVIWKGREGLWLMFLNVSCMY